MPIPLISIVIPCYNGANYIIDTLQSILKQDEQKIEIILVDDGSTDNTKILIDSVSDYRIQYVYQKNQGVSVARNNGFALAQGRYIVFFDADDMMTPCFLSRRYHSLENEIDLDFISGPVQKFNEKGLIMGYYRGTHINVHEEILLYNPEVVTCPSNYMFRRAFLKSHNILFNSSLSSTADKFFLITAAKFGKSVFNEELPPLYYRVVKNSMSHTLTKGLVIDNEVYYQQLVKNDLIPKTIQNKSLFLGDFILFASFWKVNEKGKSLKYAIRSFFRNPIEFLWKCIIKK